MIWILPSVPLFLKQGLANNEDFYYMNLLITITAGDLEELQWRIQEMKKTSHLTGYGSAVLLLPARTGIFIFPSSCKPG